jgi:hypothetical protein
LYDAAGDGRLGAEVPYRDPSKLKPGDIEECPSCHMRVIVRRDFVCPSCRVDMLTAKDDGQRRLVVFDRQQLPAICAMCGEPAQHYKPLSASRDDSDSGSVGFLGRLGIALFSPVLALLVDPKQEVSVEVAIPLCSSCVGRPRLRPEHINLERGCLTLLVHYRLSQAVENELEQS